MSKAEVNFAEQVHQRERIANVLIVDNDPTTVRLMLELLARKGIRGIVASDKKTVVEFLEKSSCELAFICDDISRSSGGGQQDLELLAKIKAISPELPVVMIANTENQKYQNQQQQGTGPGVPTAGSGGGFVRHGVHLG